MLGRTEGSQKITINTQAAIDAVAMWIGPEFGWYSASISSLAVYRDDGGVPGDLIAVSNETGIGQYEAPREAIYEFISPVTLDPGAYWLTPKIGPSDRNNPNQTDIFGSNGDAYPDGFWSANPGADAYFLLRRVE